MRNDAYDFFFLAILVGMGICAFRKKGRELIKEFLPLFGRTVAHLLLFMVFGVALLFAIHFTCAFLGWDLKMIPLGGGSLIDD